MAYATAADVAAVTGACYEAADLVQLSALLDAASEYLQSVIGCRVPVPAETVTVALTVPRGERRVRLPSAVVREVTAVTVDGVACMQWRIVDGALYRTDGWIGDGDDYVVVQVTYRHGYDVAPGDLKAWAIALAAQAFTAARSLGTLGPGAVQSVRIDDYSVSYATGGDAAGGGGFMLPAAVAAQLRASHGGGAYLVRA